MKYLHLFDFDEDEKFSVPFYKFLYDEFAIDEHYFFIPQHGNEELKLRHSNTEYFRFGILWAFKFFRMSLQCDKIIVHKIPHNIYFFLLFILCPFIPNKSAWVIWGGDLYYHEYRKKNLKTYVVEIFRKIIIPRFKFLVTHLEGDYVLAKKWYNAKGCFIYCFAYPSNLYKPLELSVRPMEKSVAIQLGNSACITNNHFELLEDLEFIKDENVTLYCPLSYSGKEEYIKDVVEKGYCLFGRDKFIPILEFMPHRKYMDFLSMIDVTVFNHDRQRGLGNIISLLSLGKKVYIKESISTWQFCETNEIRVFSVNKELTEVLTPLSEEVKLKNRNLMRLLFSADNLKIQLATLFEA